MLCDSLGTMCLVGLAVNLSSELQAELASSRASDKASEIGRASCRERV